RQRFHPRRKKQSPVCKRSQLATPLSQLWPRARRQVHRLPSSMSQQGIRLNSRFRMEPMSGIRTVPERTMAVRHESELTGAESRNVLIVSDDPGFSRQLVDKWQQERNVPAFTVL